MSYSICTNLTGPNATITVSFLDHDFLFEASLFLSIPFIHWDQGARY